MKFLVSILLICLTINSAFGLPARDPKNDAEVVSVPRGQQIGVGVNTRVSTTDSDDVDETDPNFRNFKGVIDTGAGYPFLSSFPYNPFSFQNGFFDNFEDVFRRLRERVFNNLWSDVPQPGDVDWDGSDGNSTSEVKVIDGHKVVVNDTVYTKKDDSGNAIFRVRILNIRPVDSSEETTGITGTSSSSSSSIPNRNSNDDNDDNNKKSTTLSDKNNDENTDKGSPEVLEKLPKDNEISGNIDSTENRTLMHDDVTTIATKAPEQYLINSDLIVDLNDDDNNDDNDDIKLEKNMEISDNDNRNYDDSLVLEQKSIKKLLQSENIDNTEYNINDQTPLYTNDDIKLLTTMDFINSQQKREQQNFNNNNNEKQRIINEIKLLQTNNNENQTKSKQINQSNDDNDNSDGGDDNITTTTTINDGELTTQRQQQEQQHEINKSKTNDNENNEKISNIKNQEFDSMEQEKENDDDDDDNDEAEKETQKDDNLEYKKNNDKHKIVTSVTDISSNKPSIASVVSTTTTETVTITKSIIKSNNNKDNINNKESTEIDSSEEMFDKNVNNNNRYVYNPEWDDAFNVNTNNNNNPYINDDNNYENNNIDIYESIPVDLSNDIAVNQMLADQGAPHDPDAEILSNIEEFHVLSLPFESPSSSSSSSSSRRLEKITRQHRYTNINPSFSSVRSNDNDNNDGNGNSHANNNDDDHVNIGQRYLSHLTDYHPIKK